VADRSYVHGGRVDEIVASQEGAGGPWYNHHYDAQGNCIMLTSGGTSGTLQEQYDYDAFGFPYFYTATGGKLLSPPHTRFLFTGREWLRELRVYDYRARQYQPELGRFLQPDPQGFSAGDYNIYRYCHNDPINKSDPMGLGSLDEKLKIPIVREAVPLGSHIKQWVSAGSITLAKSLLASLAKAAITSHLDITQVLFKDGTLSAFAKEIPVRTLRQGTQLLDHKEENLPSGEGHGGSLLSLHFHNNLNGANGNSTMLPSAPGPDANWVRNEQAPMLFSSESLYSARTGYLITPNGRNMPVSIPVNLDK
jgi:RHS repeat-associated protein